MASKVDNQFSKDLHDSIQRRAVIAQKSVDEMMKNPYTIEQVKEQVRMLNGDSPRGEVLK